MKVLTWNLNHRTMERRIKPGTTNAISVLGADLVIFTEYVYGPTRQQFIGGLAEVGLRHCLLSPVIKGQNSVLIVSREPLVQGDIVGQGMDPALRSNLLHAVDPASGIEVLGIRVPDFSRQPRQKRACWDSIEVMAEQLISRASVILGDFNTDPNYSAARCGNRISKLHAAGWQNGTPEAGASYWTPRGHGVRIDHAFLSPSLALMKAEYVASYGDQFFAGGGPRALSDHAVLSVEFKATGQ
jgi:endonuclease/exonuclease/phosphatase family metal-dependent hydrolase